MRNKDLRIMIETSVLVGAALALSFVRIWQMPQGGSVTLEMLPLFVLAFRHGGKMGLVGGAVFGVLQLFFTQIYHPIQVVLDYPVAFMVLGVAGFGYLRKVPVLGVAVGAFLRYLCHVLSGVVFFAQWTPEGTPVLLYSLGYNASYMVVQALAVAILIQLLKGRREIFEPHYK